MKKEIKSLTLSIEEIATLIEITDIEERRQVMQSLMDGAQNPSKEIVEANYAESHPMALRIAKKISRKAKAAARRRERNQQKMSQLSSTESGLQNKDDEMRAGARRPREISLFLNDDIAHQLQWLKRNYRTFIQNLGSIAEKIEGTDLPRRICEQLQPLFDRISPIILPLAYDVDNYFKTWAPQRPKRISFIAHSSVAIS